MGEHTAKRSIVIAVVWMVVLSMNAGAAYMVTTPPDFQFGPVGVEDDWNPMENTRPSADENATDRPDSGDQLDLNAGTAGGDRTKERSSAGNDQSSENEPFAPDESVSDEWSPDRKRHTDTSRSGGSVGRDGDTVWRANGGRNPLEKPGKSGTVPPGRQPNSCTSGHLLAKYEARGGTFVFEKGRNVVTMTGVVRDDDGELRGFAFESSAFVSTVAVKAGPETQTVEIHGRFGTIDRTGEKHAISNVVFCQNPFYQVDFVTGTPIEHLSDETIYGERKIQFAGGVVGADNPERWSAGDSPACLGSVERIDIIDDGTAATVTFDVEERCTLSLVSYETQSLRFDRHNAHRQVLVDSVTRTFDPGRYEVIVSLPDARPSDTGEDASEERR